jgi:DNA-binding CsgD family transcriptional regulator/pimeloyl-ACP methyl ester carboxylesterase
MWQHEPAFRAFFEAMATRYRFIQFDGRGMGLSSRGLGPSHTIDDRHLDFEAVVERLHLDRVCLIAPHQACHIAVPYAIEHPERVEGLVLWTPGWNQSEMGRLLLPYEELIRGSWELFVRTLAQNFGVGDPELDARRVRESVTPEDFITDQNAVRNCNLRPVLPLLNVPTLVLGPRNSPLTPKSEDRWRGAAGLIQNSRLVLLDDGSSIGGLTTDSGIPPAATAVIDFFDGLATGQAEAHYQLPAGLLSKRELEVLRLLAAGRSNQQIADELVISLNTVRRHVSNVFDKTGVANRAQATAYAKDHGIA